MPGSCTRIVAVAWPGKDENTAGFLLCPGTCRVGHGSIFICLISAQSVLRLY